MPNPQSILRDVRALGTSAPLRAGYEASKRTNFHRVLFREVPDHGHRSVSLPVGGVVPTSATARERCLGDAHAIIDEGVRVFGTRAPTGVTASWATDPLTLSCWPEGTPWWQIDIRTDARLSDVKHVWEAGRHRDLVVLARAAVLDPEGPWLATLTDMLMRWCRECRPEQGVHWYSSLELALRAIAWGQVITLVGDRMLDGLRAELDHQLVASARHLMVELPYTMSSMKNNHLLGDGLGLVVLGRLFPTHPSATRWGTIGDRLMLKQLARHMKPDGSMIEDSLSYHRFVLEMFIVRHLLGQAPAAITEAMRSASEHLVRIGATSGPVPQYGDWDEGRVLADSKDAGDVAGAAFLGLALAGVPLPGTAWDGYDELAWYVTPGSEGPAPEAASGSWTSGHFTGSASGPWRVWVKSALTQSHQHADLTSVWIQHDGTWVTQDPGTGTYNGPIQVRNGFRTSTAHPVWVPMGADLLGPHRAFRWERSDVPRGRGQTSIDDLAVHAVWHEAFGDRVLRVVLVDAAGVTIADRLPTDAGPWTMTVPTGAGSTELVTPGSAPTVSGQESPFAGWASETYGEWHPADWRMLTSPGGWVVWGAGRVGAVSDETATSLRLGDRVIEIVGDTVRVTRDDRTAVCEAPRA